jgi:hypothetical protein
MVSVLHSACSGLAGSRCTESGAGDTGVAASNPTDAVSTESGVAVLAAGTVVGVLWQAARPKSTGAKRNR